MTDQVKVNLFSESLSESKMEGLVDNSLGPRKYYIEGIVAQAELLNRNGRIYPADILLPDVERYRDSHVMKGLAWGELDHPEKGVSVSMKNVSHRFVDLRIEGHNVIGKAIILDNPLGEMVKSCIDSGGQICVSTRGLGKSVETENYEEMRAYYMTAIDIVSFPSGIDCFVNGVKEGVDFLVESALLSKAEAFKIVYNQSDMRVSADEFSKAIKRILKG